MTTEEVLRTSAGRHIGYQPMSIWQHATNPFCWEQATALRKIPGKITAFFHRHLITEVRKVATDPAGLYFLKLTDGTFLEVEY